MFTVLVETERGPGSTMSCYYTDTFGSALALVKELACYKEALRCDTEISEYCITIGYEVDAYKEA